MIDIHTHILPGLDDGADSMEMSLAMARTAAAEGITDIIATPHHANGKYLNPGSDVRTAVWNFQSRLQLEGIPITVHPGQEIRVHDDLLDAAERGELLALADSAYMLIELPSGEIPARFEELLHELVVLGVKPIIAHPERNRAIREKPRLLGELVEQGALAQVTTHSLLGDFGDSVKKAAWTLCRMGYIQFVSSDAHHVERRNFSLKRAYEAITDQLGLEHRDYYLYNASALLANRAISGKAPRAKEHKFYLKFARMFQK